MQLLIITTAVLPGNPFLKDLKTYKYRSEVKIFTRLPDAEIGKITGSAYAFIYPVLHQDAGLSLLQPMQCGVPVVVSNTAAFGELAGSAALYVDSANFEDIADKMMLVFKDETKRAELITMGHLTIKKIKQSNQGEKLWDIVCNESPHV